MHCSMLCTIDQMTSTLFPFPEYHTCTVREKVTIKADPSYGVYEPEEEMKVSRRVAAMEEATSGIS